MARPLRQRIAPNNPGVSGECRFFLRQAQIRKICSAGLHIDNKSSQVAEFQISGGPRKTMSCLHSLPISRDVLNDIAPDEPQFDPRQSLLPQPDRRFKAIRSKDSVLGFGMDAKAHPVVRLINIYWRSNPETGLGRLFGRS